VVHLGLEGIILGLPEQLITRSHIHPLVGRHVLGSPSQIKQPFRGIWGQRAFLALLHRVRLLDFHFRYQHQVFLCLVVFGVVKIEYLGIAEELPLLPLILQPLLMLFKVCLHGPYRLYGIMSGPIKGDRLGVRILSSCFLDS
jgi:hypothetical protein